MGPLLLVAAVTARSVWGTKARAAYVYFGAAAGVFLATAGKVGSDSNYQIETAIALVICSCLGLHAMEFFPAYYRGSKSWITLLILPLVLYAVQNLRLGFFGLAGRAGRALAFCLAGREFFDFETLPQRRAERRIDLRVKVEDARCKVLARGRHLRRRPAGDVRAAAQDERHDRSDAEAAGALHAYGLASRQRLERAVEPSGLRLAGRVLSAFEHVLSKIGRAHV